MLRLELKELEQGQPSSAALHRAEWIRWFERARFRRAGLSGDHEVATNVCGASLKNVKRLDSQ